MPFPALFILFPYVREEAHETGALDRVRELPLMLCTDGRMPRVDDLRLARNKTPQKINFFIINVVQILRAEKALGHIFMRY